MYRFDVVKCINSFKNILLQKRQHFWNVLFVFKVTI